MKDFIWAVIAAVLLELLFLLLERNGVVAEQMRWKTAIATLFFAVGVYLMIRLKEVAKPYSLILPPLVFAISVFFFVLAVSPRPSAYDLLEFSSIDWKKLLNQANREVLAEGVVLDFIDVSVLVNRLKVSPALNVKMVILDPAGRVLDQRTNDESTTAPHENKARIVEKIREFEVSQTSSEGAIWKGRFQLLVRDTYPTIAVVAIDDDLYAYLYSFRGKGRESPVFRLLNYKKSANPLASFLEAHLVKSLDQNEGAYPPKDYRAYH